LPHSLPATGHERDLAVESLHEKPRCYRKQERIERGGAGGWLTSQAPER
jgi:hypothetical protein